MSSLVVEGKHYEVRAGPLATPCWVWKGDTNADGYAIRRIGTRSLRVHRLTYAERYGEEPPLLDHECDVRPCVNPEHVRPLSQAANVRRGRSAKLTAEQVAAIRADDRVPRIIAEEYGVSRVQISRIRNGKRWA